MNKYCFHDIHRIDITHVGEEGDKQLGKRTEQFQQMQLLQPITKLI